MGPENGGTQQEAVHEGTGKGAPHQILAYPYLNWQALREEAEKEAAEMKRRREQRKKQKLENEKKSEVVQVIRNTAKIKRMSKKQLLTLQKR